MAFAVVAVAMAAEVSSSSNNNKITNRASPSDVRRPMLARRVPPEGLFLG
jgi:hypothetical protein